MKSRNCGRWCGMGAVGVMLVMLTGCSLLAPFYFGAIFLGMDPRLPPKFLFPEDAGRVLVVTNVNYGTQIDLGRIDRELNQLISRRLYEGFQGERKMREIQVIKADTLAKWQDEHEDWRSLEPVEIGRALNADYVIYIHIDEISFYQDGHTKHLLQGSSELTIRVVMVDEYEGELVLPSDPLSVQYPRSHSIPVGETSYPRFRRAFLSRLAEQVSWYFLPHEQINDYGLDPI